MPHHVHVTLPTGEYVVANVDEPVVPHMRRYLVATAINHEPPRQRDEDAIRTWYMLNADQSALCAIHQCDHI